MIPTSCRTDSDHRRPALRYCHPTMSKEAATIPSWSSSERVAGEEHPPEARPVFDGKFPRPVEV